MAKWFVTGASRGIGLGICKELLAKGHDVIGACRNPDGARDLWELASDFKDQYRTVQLDVGDNASIERIAKEFSGETIDVLVNNAGIMRGDADTLMTMKFEDLQKSFEVNTIAPMRVTRALMPALKRSKTPRIASISSMMGSMTDNRDGGYYAYRMSKTALNMFHNCLAREFPDIISLTLHPGWVQTQMGGDKAPLSVYDSAAGLVRVISDAEPHQSGTFLDYKGAKIPW